jgi:hypothetical protein
MVMSGSSLEVQAWHQLGAFCLKEPQRQLPVEL